MKIKVKHKISYQDLKIARRVLIEISKEYDKEITKAKLQDPSCKDELTREKIYRAGSIDSSIEVLSAYLHIRKNQKKAGIL